MKMPHLTKTSLILLGTFAVLALFIVAGFSLWPREKAVSQTQTPLPIADPTADWKTYRNEEYGFEVKYPDFLIPLNRTGGQDDFYRNLREHQYITFRTPEQISWMKIEEFPFPTFAILVMTGFSIEQWVDYVIGCQNEIVGYADLCIKHGDVTEQLINGIQFVTFHEPGPVDGVYHHAIKKGDLLIDVQTFRLPNENPLKVHDILRTLD